MIINNHPHPCTTGSSKLPVTVNSVICNMLPVIGQSQGDHSHATWGTAAGLTFVQLVRQNWGTLQHPTIASYSVQFSSPRSETNVTRNHSN